MGGREGLRPDCEDAAPEVNLENSKPLEYATMNGQWSLVARLAEVDIDLEYTGVSRRTVLSLAAEADEKELVGLLRNRGAKI